MAGKKLFLAGDSGPDGLQPSANSEGAKTEVLRRHLGDTDSKLFYLLHQEAIETFKETLKLKPDFIDAYKSLGQAYRYCWPAFYRSCVLAPA